MAQEWEYRSYNMSSFKTRTAAYFKRSNERGDQEGQGHKLSDGGIHFESESEVNTGQQVKVMQG